MSMRSACPDSIMTPGDMNPWFMYQAPSVTSVSVQIVPVPIEPGSASRPVTRSASSKGGSGIRT